MARIEKCPICNAEVRPRPENPSHPFCTARCKTIDLGKWLNEEYRIPVPGEEAEQEEQAEQDDDEETSSNDGSKTNEDMRH